MSLNNRRHETTESGKMNRNFAGEHPAAIRAALLTSHMQSPQLNRKVSVIGAGPEVG